MAEGIQSVSNFLGPAVGTMSAYVVNRTFSATPFFVDFNKVQLDGRDYRPSGVYIDNSQGVDNLTVLINEMSLRMVCAAGESMQMPFPSPVGVTANITGDGTATVVFVDYPVMPFYTGLGGSGGAIPNPLPVTGPLTDGELRASPVPVSGPLTDTQLRATAVPVSLPSVARASTMSSVSASGSVAAGSKMVSFKNTGATAVTVAGGSLAANDIVTFTATGADTLAAIAYDATGGTLQIARTV